MTVSGKVENKKEMLKFIHFGYKDYQTNLMVRLPCGLKFEEFWRAGSFSLLVALRGERVLPAKDQVILFEVCLALFM